MKTCNRCPSTGESATGAKRGKKSNWSQTQEKEQLIPNVGKRATGPKRRKKSNWSQRHEKEQLVPTAGKEGKSRLIFVLLLIGWLKSVRFWWVRKLRGIIFDNQWKPLQRLLHKRTLSSRALWACCTLSMCSSLSFLTISAVWRASSASKLASSAAISCSCCFSKAPTSPPSLITCNENHVSGECVRFHRQLKGQSRGYFLYFCHKVAKFIS